jgi:hypothetical protein
MKGAGGSAAFNAAAIAVVVLAGALCLALPFWGDQALFTVYARQLAQGAVLYRDIFDVKQPGIFLFYVLGGSLFGYTEIGIHLFELMYWLAFSAFAIAALRPYFPSRWAPPLVPVFSVAVYYLYAGLLDLTQIEILVGFPLLLAWWLLDRADPRTSGGRNHYAAAGLVAAAIVLLKHLYLLIVFAFVAHAAVRSWRRGATIADLQRALRPFVIALVAPLFVVFMYFAALGQLGRVWWAYLEVAPAQQLMAPRSIDFLIYGARHFMIGHGPVLILATLGCIYRLRRRAHPQVSLVIAMLLWLAVGAVAFFILQGWPVYKWALFTMPLGVLAVVGVEAIVDATAGARKSMQLATLAVGTALAIASFAVGAPAPELQTRLLLSVVIGVGAAIGAELLQARPRAREAMLCVLPAALAVSVGLAAIFPARKLRSLIDHEFASTADSRTNFQRSWNIAYRNADEDLGRLHRGRVLPGPFYVFGDPVLLLRANRPQGASILGWGPDFLDRKEWQVLHAELQANLPPYIIVDAYSASKIRSRYPVMMGLLQSKYEVAFVGASGTWYVRR